MSQILIIDDNPDMLDTLQRLFSFFQFKVITEVDGKNAVELAEKNKPDIVIVDAHMPGMDGFEICKKLKDGRKTKHIPVMILSTKIVDDHIRNLGQDAGADDYVMKPFNSKELVSRVKTILKRTFLKGLVHTETGAETVRRELKATQKNGTPDIPLNTALDGLTGLYSKKYLWTRLKEEFHRALRYETAVSFILLDVDSFGKINDTFSYQVGDYVLLKIANTILSNTRITDVVARLEGANFAIILPQTDAQGGYFEAERLRVALNQMDYRENFLRELFDDIDWRKIESRSITISAGVGTYLGEKEIRNEKDLYALTKKALDRAKTGGKNKTVTFAPVV
jgi:diguanylate cyclase (GGDEF)-like protein